MLQGLDPAAPLSILSEAITGSAQEKLGEAGLPRLPRRFAGELLESVIVEIPPKETRVWDGFVEIGYARATESSRAVSTSEASSPIESESISTTGPPRKLTVGIGSTPGLRGIRRTLRQ